MLSTPQRRSFTDELLLEGPFGNTGARHDDESTAVGTTGSFVNEPCKFLRGASALADYQDRLGAPTGCFLGKRENLPQRCRGELGANSVWAAQGRCLVRLLGAPAVLRSMSDCLASPA